MASLALPGMSGFVAEIMIFLGMLTSASYSLTFRFVITFIEAIGIILTPIYLLSMIRQIFYGYKNINIINQSILDAGPREIFVFSSLFLPMIGIGLCPTLVLPLWEVKSKVITTLVDVNQLHYEPLVYQK
jgi:NAD(P)H-quinone oxidoreductase subunit 4